MRLINADNLYEHKFVGVEHTYILAGRRNGKTELQKLINNAYQVGWNTAIETIVENEPTVEPIIRCKDCKYQVKEWREDKRRKNGGYWVYACSHFGEIIGYWGWGGDDNQYCSDAEMKEK